MTSHPSQGVRERAREILSRLVQYRAPRPKGNNPLYKQDVDYLARMLESERIRQAEEDAKAVCADCRKEVPLLLQLKWYHQGNSYRKCPAAAIRERLKEMEAE